jgi:hypothetical protein
MLPLLEEWEFKMMLENIAPLTEENQEPMVLDRYGSAPEPYEW